MDLSLLIKERVGSDVRLAMILMFGALAIVGVTPFAVMRALGGEWVAASLDTALVLLISGGVLYAWQTGRSAMVGKLLAVGVSATGALLTENAGNTAQFWAYAVILANFMLAPRWLAVACSLLIAAAQMRSDAFDGFMTAMAFVVSAMLVMLYAYIFASLTETQRGKLEHLASRDPLTGVANRRSMEVELAESLRGHLARGEPATLAVLDLDHFKSVNDTHGHDTGDRVILGFVERMQASLRKRDRIYRLGGEEFVVLLPGTDHSGARAALEKLRDRVQAAPLADAVRVTTSIGAAVLEPGDDWPRWLARADAALYRAKANGRDCVSFDSTLATPGERRLRLVQGRPLP